jgi:hypothetical protein
MVENKSRSTYFLGEFGKGQIKSLCFNSSTIQLDKNASAASS